MTSRPAEMPFSDETRQIMTDALIFEHRPEIARVIFCSPSHRGADMATSFFGRMGSKLIGGPKKLLNGDTSALALAKPTLDRRAVEEDAQQHRLPQSREPLRQEPRRPAARPGHSLPFHPGRPRQGRQPRPHRARQHATASCPTGAAISTAPKANSSFPAVTGPTSIRRASPR